MQELAQRYYQRISQRLTVGTMARLPKYGKMKMGFYASATVPAHGITTPSKAMK